MHFAANAQILSPDAGYRQAGVSIYTEQVLRRLPNITPGEPWTVYVPRASASKLGHPPNLRLRATRLPTTNPIGRICWEQFIAPIVVARDRPDVLFCPLNIVPLSLRCPTVVTIHDLAFLRFPELRRPAKRRYLSLLTRLSVQRAAHVLTVSEFTRQEVIELLGLPPSKVTATPNGRDEDLGPLPRATVEQFRQEHGLPDQFLLFLGTLEPRKNLVTLLRAYAQVRTVLKMPLIVAGGKGWLYEPIFQLVEELGLGDQVRFAGYVPRDELALWYNAATAFVYPSLYEGFGLPPLEALQCGTPVITSNAASMPEAVGDAALLVEPTDVDAWGVALMRMATDANLRAELRMRGPEQAARFSWESTAAGTLTALRAAADH